MAKAYEVIESKSWRAANGRTASIYGALPYFSDAQKAREGWEIVVNGWTVYDVRSNTVGCGRPAWKTREEAQAFVDKAHAGIDERRRILALAPAVRS